MSRAPLSEDALAKALADLPEWRIADGKLHRELRFPDFVHAFGFMASVALAAEARNHHPEWSNVYDRVVVDLTTHDAGGITEKDLELARTIDALVG